MRIPKFFLVLLTLAVIATAAPFSSVIVFGDSLSDNGNLYALTSRPPSPPYYAGRFSNGPVAVEKLASDFGTPLQDYAFAGATTGVGNYGDGGTTTAFGAYNLPGMTTTYDMVSPSFPSAIFPGALFIVWGGPNDFLTDGPTPAVAYAAASRIANIVTDLQVHGAKHILVPGAPDLGLTPDSLAGGPSYAAGATALISYFNSQLQAMLPAGATYVDTFFLLRDMVHNPALYGFTNTTAPCLDKNTMTACANPDQYIFWDGQHPTAAVNDVVAARFEQAAVPEPATFAFVFSAAVLLAAVRFRRHAG